MHCQVELKLCLVGKIKLELELELNLILSSQDQAGLRSAMLELEVACLMFKLAYAELLYIPTARLLL